jgi:hypothetical protein
MKTHQRRHQKGFALIVTLSLMVLLALLAVGLLSLSAVTLRSASQGSAQAEARANARLALMLAIGQLQKYAGDDRRISRAADQIPGATDGSKTAALPGRRFWTGIYKSWDGDQAQRPGPELLQWLVSHPQTSAAREDEPTAAASPGEMVRLVGAGTAGGSKEDWVEAPLVGVESGGRLSGRFAWWTGDQGLKAMLASPPAGDAKDLAELRGRLQAAPSHAVQLASTSSGRPFRGTDRTDPRIEALTGWGQASFLATDRDGSRELFHDLVTRTGGLLVDVRNGGFRRDLSMKFEGKFPPAGREPLYTVASEEGISFEELQSYYRLYKELEPVSGAYTTGGAIPAGTLGFEMGASPGECQKDPAFHFKMPVMVSLQIAFSLQARPIGNPQDENYRLYLVGDPILTFWNPLGVPVVIPQTAWMTFAFFQLPYTINVESGGENRECPLISTLSGATVNRISDTNFLGLRVGQLDPKLVFKPGEVIKVSQSGNLRVEGNSPNRALQAQVGFNYGGGMARPMRDKFGKTIDLKLSDRITYTMEPNGMTCGKTQYSGESMTGARMHSRHHGLHYHEFFVGTDRPNAGGIGFGGMSIDADFGNQRAQPGIIWQARTPGTKPPGARIYANRGQYADIFPTFGASDTRPLSVEQLRSAKAPILMYSYNVKTETGSETGTRSLLRFNPRAHRVDFYDLTKFERDLKPYEFKMEALNSWVNRKLETSANGNAYFGGSYDAADGNCFVTTHSVPREPIHSLAALQHSMANGFMMQAPQQGYTALNARQPMLPQISHAIGNSFAPAVLSSSETEGLTSGNRPLADHSYLANAALWDGWFFSSVAPHETGNHSVQRSQRQAAEQFLDGSKPLPISQYRPALGSKGVAESLASLFSRNDPSPGATDLMASLIRVEGMFNVNSTSVEAWRVLLSSLMGEDVVTRDDLGKLSRREVAEGVPVAGLMAPANRLAKGTGAITANEPEQWIGRRVLKEDEITLLAETIVREVRKRGPFLSLADFVNRRVGSDPALARAGAIQSALDSDEVPINAAYNAAARSVDSVTAARLPFPEAEEGARAAGIPGIVKQADLLTPLAPILSARSDTFLIRAYGEAVDGNGRILARAWCEAEVERGADFLSGEDPRETRPADLSNAVDREFGRRFKIHSFRWLGSKEI